MLSADYRELEPQHLNDLAARWAPGAQVVKLLGKVENLVWRVESPHGLFVLRLTEPTHRSEAALQAELNWLDHLVKLDLPVCRPLLSLAHVQIEKFEYKGQELLVSAFEWLEGVALDKNQKAWSIPVVQSLGKLAAKLHLQGHSLPPELLAARPVWQSNNLIDRAAELLPDDEWLLERLTTCRQTMASLPQTRPHYGLIHGDIHIGNFLVLDQQVRLFDFDDCHLGWHAQDLALILYSALPLTGPTETFADWFLQQMRTAYITVRPWPELMSETLELFLHWRDLTLILFLKCRWPEQPPERQRAYLEQLRTRARSGKTLLDAV